MTVQQKRKIEQLGSIGQNLWRGIASLPGLDVRIKVVQDVVDFLLDRKGDDAKEWCDENEENLLRNGYRADGVRVTAGESWGMPFAGIEGMETVEK